MSTPVRAAGAFVATAALCVAAAAGAQDLPRSYLASPDVYKVLAEDARFQVILVSWKPGQRDAAHAHPASGVYYLTDCSQRLYRPDGSVVGDGHAKAGRARVQDAVPGHIVENIGASECRLVMFEPR